MTSQPSLTASDSGSPLDPEYIELYRLAVEMADRVSSRRTAANNFFLALHAAMVTVVGLIRPLQSSSAVARPQLFDPLPIVVTSIAGLALAAAWFLGLRSYRDLNRAKYAVIVAMEKRLPAQVFGDEWQSLRKDDVPWWRGSYTEQGTVERVVPLIFGAIYLVALFATLWRQ